MSVFSRTDNSLLSTWWWTIDRWMLVALSLLIGLGIVMTFGASPAIAQKLGLDDFHFVRRQLMFLVVAVSVMFGVSLLTPLQVRRLGVILFAACLVLLVVTLFVAPETKGARRWIRFGSFTLQASEFIKPSFVIVAAWMFSEGQKSPQFPGWKIALTLYLCVATLLISQPDFGQTMLITLVWGAQFFMAGLPMVWVAGLAATTVGGTLMAYIFIPHVTSRIDRFLNPENSDTYQIDTALNAFRSGGLFGRGPGEGAVKKILPDAHTDFIFAVMGEEFGVILCMLLIALFAVIVIRGLVNLLKVSDMFTFLALAGLFMQFGLQAFINLAVNLGVIPSKGMTLPFVSYGGSSMLALAIGMGMVFALTRRRPDTLENMGKNYGRTVQ